MNLFKQPKPVITQPVNPADTQNRLADQRLQRINQGGSNTTTLTQASSPQLGGPRSTLTGVG